MGFWTDYNTEPARQNRWVVYIGGIPQWIAKSATKPSFEVSLTTHKYINHEFQYPGRVSWKPIEVTLVEPLSPDASKTVENIMTSAGYHFPENPADVSSISKANAIRALGKVTIVQLNAEGGHAQEWELTNGWVQSAVFGELNYENEGMVEIKMTIQYDYAKISKSGIPIPVDGI